MSVSEERPSVLTCQAGAPESKSVAEDLHVSSAEATQEAVLSSQPARTGPKGPLASCVPFAVPSISCADTCIHFDTLPAEESADIFPNAMNVQ